MSKLPDEVPILTGHNFCKFGLTSKSGSKHCIVGWSADVFAYLDNTMTTGHAWNKVPKKVRDAIGKTSPVEGYAGYRYPSTLNDDPDISTSTLAKWWNQAMAELGYTEGNPCSK